MRIGAKVFLAMSGVLLVSSAIQGGIPTLMVRDALVARAERDIQAEALELQRNLEDLLAQTHGDAAVLRSHRSFENYLTLKAFEDVDSMVEELGALEPFLVRMAQAKPEYATLQFATADGPALQISNAVKVEQFTQFPTAEALRALRAAPRESDGRPLSLFVGDAESLVLRVAAPLKSSGSVDGVLWIERPLDAWLARKVEALANREIEVAISDSGGRALMAGFDRVRQAIEADAAQWLTADSAVQALGWQIVVAVDADRAMQIVDRVTWSTLLVAAVALVVTVAIVELLLLVMVVRPIRRVVTGLNRIAEEDGDLRVRLEVRGRDEISALASAFNRFVAKVESTVAEVQSGVRQILEAGAELTRTAGQTDEAVKSQQLELGSAANATEEMTACIAEVARNAVDTANAANEVSDNATLGRKLVNDSRVAIEGLAAHVETTTDVVGRLGVSSTEIGNVIEVIRAIAEQTNLLALNAAIEAARAGEHGRGFAVVADEVRTLAAKTQKATVEIQDMIDRLQAASGEAVGTLESERGEADASVKVACQADEALVRIDQASSETRDRIAQIASAAEEQTTTANAISRNVVEVSAAAERAASAASDMALGARAVAELVENLDRTVRYFKVAPVESGTTPS